MRQLLTKGIVLSRTDFGEADRIITLLTPDSGKLRLMAKGVRRVKSKLAGGIELFSVSDITYLPGKGEVGTLVSTRLDRHYGNIVKDIERVQLGYDLIKRLNKATEDNPEEAYFDLLKESFEALNNENIDLELIKIWFQAQLLKFSGHMPNLQTNAAGSRLQADVKYNFDFDSMAFAPHANGRFSAGHIKVLRLLFSANPPAALTQVGGIGGLLKSCGALVQAMAQTASA